MMNERMTNDERTNERTTNESERATLCRRIDELCAEVEALKRDEWAAGFNAGCDAVEAAYEDGRPFYEVENAKLRELVRKIEHYERVGCHECPYVGTCDAGTLYDDECVMSREIEREKGELGIEVDDG